MFKKTLISSVAVAALAITGAAYAQNASPERGQSQSAPVSPKANDAARGVAPGQQSKDGAPGAARESASERAQERTGSGGSTTTTGQSGASGSATTGAQSETRGAERSGERMTTGQVPKIEINAQQRTELRSRFKQVNIRTVERDRINVAIGIGAVLPSTVTFVPIPDPIVTLVPQFRGYHVVRVGDQILIVEPGTRRIVYIIEA